LLRATRQCVVKRKSTISLVNNHDGRQLVGADLVPASLTSFRLPELVAPAQAVAGREHLNR
jgi:hypothetical protein